jgi:hypothetical protein
MLFLYFVFVHLSLLLPGYVIACNLLRSKKQNGVEICSAYLITIFLCATLAFSAYILDISHDYVRTLHWLVLIVSAYFFLKQKLYSNLLSQAYPLLALLLITTFSTLFISLSFTGVRNYIPDPLPVKANNYDVLGVKVLNVAQTNANDNYIPYRQAQFIINESDPAKDSFINEWGVHFFQRTPLLGSVAAEYFILLDDFVPVHYTWSALGDDPELTYKKFQIIAHILNGLFVVPAYYLLRLMFSRKTAVASLLFIIPSQFFLFNSFFSWPKSLVAFFILFSWYLILKNKFRYTLLAGIASGMAYLAHDLSVLYTAATVILLLSHKRFRDTFIIGGVTVLFIAPWFVASAILYKKPSSFIYYPFSLHSIPQPKDKVIEEFFHTSPLRIAAIKLESLFYLLSPYQAIYSEGNTDVSRRIWALGLFSVPGAAGLGLLIPAALGAIRKIAGKGFWILTLTPILVCLLIIGWPKGLGALHFAQASVVLIIGLATSCLLMLSSKRWLLLAYIANASQLVIFTLFSFDFSVAHWLTNVRDTALLSVLISILIICGLTLWNVSYFLKRFTRFVP